MKIRIIFLIVALMAIFSVGCSYAHSNMQTLITTDCGVTWTLIKAGQSIPTGTANPCYRKVTIPDYPMQGDAKFKSTFKGNTKADIDLSYNYRITDAIKFINEAKYIGSQSASEDGKANDTRFEGAENAVIDRHIRDIQRDLLVSEDIVDFDAPAFEEKLLKPVNERLAERGVQIDYISFVPNPSPVTEDAIDVSTALRVYKANGIPEEVAYKLMVAKLGAANIGLKPDDSPPPAKKD